MKKRTQAMILIGFGWTTTASALDVAYQYDDLNRLIEVNYGNGQQIIQYSYDAAGNILSKNVIVADQLPPQLTVTSPLEGDVVTANPVTILGTATDGGRGESGIASVSVQGQSATGGTASGADIANWSAAIDLSYGDNTLSIIAADASPFANKTQKTLHLRYQPPYIDSDSDQIDDNWEQYYFNDLQTASAQSDFDGDGQSDQLEYQRGSDPTDINSRSVDVQLKFAAGFQPLFYPLNKVEMTTAFLLLAELRAQGMPVKEIQGLNQNMGLFQVAQLDPATGSITGDDFELNHGQGVFARFDSEATLAVAGPVSCQPINLQTGINIVGFNCISPNYTASQLMADILPNAAISSIQRFDEQTGRFEAVVNQEGIISGDDFTIEIGKAYLFNMLEDYTLAP